MSYRNLDFWIRSGFFTPSVAADGAGTERVYSFEDLAIIRLAWFLREQGVESARVRSLIQYLEHRARPLRGWLAMRANDTRFFQDGLEALECAADCGAAMLVHLDRVIGELERAIEAEER